MKKVKLSIVMVLLLSLPFMYIKAKHFWRGETMSLRKVCKTWGVLPLDIAQFKQAEEDETIRAKMACSLLQNQQNYIGKTPREIRELFGDYTGYYFNDTIPTYVIKIAEKKGQDTWQIVFLIDLQGKISQIIVHKNCCD